MTAMEPDDPLRLFLRVSKEEAVMELPLQPGDVEQHVERCRGVLQQIHGGIQGARVRRDKKNEAYRLKSSVMVEFATGDYVLVYRVVMPSKLNVRWQGPYQVTDTVSPWVFRVKHLVSLEELTVHASRMRYFDNASLDVTEELRAIAGHIQTEYVPERIVSWREDGGSLFFEVHWKGFEEAEATFEPFEQLKEDVPELLCAYLEEHRSESQALQLAYQLM
eukprot:Rmarinus@m.1923